MDEISIGIDTQLFSFLIDAWQLLGPEKDDPLYDEKIALAYLFFYHDGHMNRAPTVVKECEQIKDEERRKKHENFPFIPQMVPYKLQDLEKRKTYYKQFHTGERNENDCDIVAEAENCGCQIFLTFDNQIIKRLADKTKSMEILRPSEYWERLNIPKGIEPKNSPRYDNPLKTNRWWEW